MVARAQRKRTRRTAVEWMSVDLTIDGRPGSAAPGATILQAAHVAGIDIPTVCQDEFKACACSVSAT